MKKKLILIISLLVLALAVVGCGGGEKKAADGKAAMKVLKIGTNPDFAPFEFLDSNGKMAGFDLDLIHAIGKKIGKEIKMENIAFDGLIPALQTGNIDLAIAGMAITPARQEVVLFSEPYYHSGLTILVRKDGANIAGIKDLEGKKVAVQMGTTASVMAKGIPGAVVKEFNTSADAFLELKNGGSDAVINHLPVVKYYLKSNGGPDSPFKIVGEPLTNAPDAIAAKKDNQKLIAEVNKALLEMKANGEYDALYEKWFGEKPPKQ